MCYSSDCEGLFWLTLYGENQLDMLYLFHEKLDICSKFVELAFQWVIGCLHSNTYGDAIGLLTRFDVVSDH